MTTTPDTVTTLATMPKGGGKPGNKNALRHGLRASNLPPGCGGIANSTDDYRNGLEAAELAARGCISITAAGHINTATRWERTAQLLARWLRLRCDTMSDADRLAYATGIAKASECRDRAVRALNLDAEPDAWATLQATFAEPVESEHVQPPDAVATLPSVPNVPSGQPHTTP
jgi:cytosine/adenosine deaminase-related metal-dependent hydrolase